jgi:ABC-type multidrug transport system fused ATPase/permease subunit
LRLARLQLAGEVGYVALWLVYAGTYFFAGLQAFQGNISVGAVLALGQLMASLALPTHALGALFTAYAGALGSINRLREHLQVREPMVFSTAPIEPAAELLKDSVAPSSALPLISDNVSVVLPDESMILNGVGLSVHVGEQLAVVGASGAGKSTLAAVLAGLRTSTFGQVTAGGTPLASWRESDFRKRVAIAFTEPSLFRGSIFDNVALGRAEIDQAWVSELFGLIGADDLLVSSSLIEGGHNLSSGQRQRIGLARALAVVPELLILDEATSGLDTESEARIFQAVRDRWPRMSLLVISHRLATVLQCSQAIVLDTGRVVDRGDPRALLTSSVRMAELIRAQVIASA